MDLTKATEESLLRLKDDLVNDVKNLKNKSNKKKAVFLAKTLVKSMLVAGGITTALFFSTGYCDSCTWRCGRVGRYGYEYGHERSRDKEVQRGQGNKDERFEDRQ